MNRHVLVRREETTQERRHSTDVVCVDGHTGTLDVRHHPTGRVLPLKMAAPGSKGGEKLFITDVRLLYCTNDTERDWRFELHGLWDGGTVPIQILVPPASQTRGPVPEKDQCIYRPSIMAKWPAFLPWVGMEHALMNVHSSHVGAVGHKVIDGQLFEESDPFLQFTRQHWSSFTGLSDYDVVLVSGPKDPPIYRISSHAIARITHTMKTLFEEVRYKTRDPWLELRVDPRSIIGTIGGEETVTGSSGFMGCVLLLQVAYLVVAPAVPKCRVVEQPLLMHI